MQINPTQEKEKFGFRISADQYPICSICYLCELTLFIWFLLVNLNRRKLSEIRNFYTELATRKLVFLWFYMNFAARFCPLFTQIFTITVKLRIFSATLFVIVFSDGLPNTVMRIKLKLAQISLKKFDMKHSEQYMQMLLLHGQPKKNVSFFYCHKKNRVDEI